MKKAFILSKSILGATGLLLFLNGCGSRKDFQPEKCSHNKNLQSSDFSIYKLDGLGEPTDWIGVINVRSVLQTYTYRLVKQDYPYIFGKSGSFDTTKVCSIKTLTSNEGKNYDLNRYRFEYSTNDLDKDGTKGTENGVDILDYDDILYYDFSYNDPDDINNTKYVRWVKAW